MAFTKLHGTILDSSIWAEPNHVRLVWITMLAMANEFGIVEASVSGVARRAVVSLEEAKDALSVLMGPDPDSRDGTTGERLEKVPGGWFVINHQDYRDRQTRAQALTAARVRKHRERRAKEKSVTCNNVTGRNARNELSLPEAEAEAEAEQTTTKVVVRSQPRRRSRIAPENFAPTEAHIAIANEHGVNLERELAKFKDHEFKDPKSNWDKTFANWLRQSAGYAPRRGRGRPQNSGLDPFGESA